MNLSVLRVLRLTRIFRIFKISKYNAGLQLIGRVLINSASALMLLVFFCAIGAVVCGSLIFYCEVGRPAG